MPIICCRTGRRQAPRGLLKDNTCYFGSLQRWTIRQLGSGSTLDDIPTEAGKQLLQRIGGGRPQVSRILGPGLLDEAALAFGIGGRLRLQRLQGDETLWLSRSLKPMPMPPRRAFRGRVIHVQGAGGSNCAIIAHSPVMIYWDATPGTMPWSFLREHATARTKSSA